MNADKPFCAIELCPSPLLYEVYAQKMNAPTVIVVDVLRASTTIIEALTNGAECMIIVASEEEAKSYASKGYLVGAERNARRCPFAKMGNDPGEYTPDVVGGREIVFTTTNGTQSIDTAFRFGAKEILIGGLVNLRSIADYILHHNINEVMVLAAGWRGTMSIEDSLFAGALAKELIRCDVEIRSGDAARMAADLWDLYGTNTQTLLHYLSQSEHYQRLQALQLESSVLSCITDIPHSVVPIIHQEVGRLIARSTK